MQTKHWEFVAAAALCGLLCGCNIDRLWSGRVEGEPPQAAHNQSSLSGQTTQPVDIQIADPNEVDLVENVLLRRAQYHQALEGLKDYYENLGRATKLGWARFELEGLRGVKPFRYLVDAEIPPATLKPVKSITEANTLYLQGLDLMKRGGHRVPALYREDLMVQAAEVFRQLITRFPSSDKIDDAAFFQGEIHKEYLKGQESLAVTWYERAWTWNPTTPHPARFQAATVCDYRLHDRDRALELYQLVVEDETTIVSNVRFAMRRIYELTRDVNASAEAR